MSESQITIPTEKSLTALVYFVRGEKVFIDADLAMLYGVETSALNRAVKRNPDRFPADFMFQLDAQEWENLRCQIGIASSHGGRRAAPHAFTEQGVAMLSSVLNATRAVQVNIAIMRTFVQLRRLMDSNRDLARRIDSLEARYDEQFSAVFDAIKQLITDESRRKGKPPMGFL
ncbi:DNA-binding protein [Limnohabitans sp. TS-CS-82]|uniref:ORF6N domain-containing protein n=1 Tax=Limnohabitans sp. TS-CS-82 TaxID=2094193 RepID=UPI000CF1D236|nr:ORF6N domain-containing protein [Limnohabitans sp. TS-CS-82]PQA82522.1 DNA-binding protein [Limnohabitans sp. TS-CS-82]